MGGFGPRVSERTVPLPQWINPAHAIHTPSVIPGMTLCNVEKRAWYAWLRNNLQASPLCLNVTLR